jgi:Flp pilus assembly pilin Flp
MKQSLFILWNRFVSSEFVRDEQGQDLVEYALIVAAVGLALIATVNQFSTAIVSLYSSLTQGLTSIGNGGQ